MTQTPCKHGAATVNLPLPNSASTVPTPCGAKTRTGTPCKRLDTARNGRCRLHGGKSTGPKTEVGKEQARINGRLSGRKPKVFMGSPSSQAASLTATIPATPDERTQVFSGLKSKVLLGSVPPPAPALPETLPVPPAENSTEMLGISPSDKPKPLQAATTPPNASKPTIRCSDCKHLSAAFTCLTRHTISITKEPRNCGEARDW
ncbi:MAG: hypothetical protein CO065_02350 [Comamonadaceae bacterium CG_4_9_14_0_8_um_filter_57_21]|nr:MAG: hypothetical protein CO065_02350 [Comamonadaceae bacterium CG_4_9_14_0_8_um_filter_57_21]